MKNIQATEPAPKRAPLVKPEYIVPFLLITSLFFMWGFARAFLDVLNKHFQTVLDISKTGSSLIQVMVYSAYFLVAIPAGLFISKRGYRKGVVFGLVLFGIGALLFIPSEKIMPVAGASTAFAAFLFALFVLGCGLVFLETAANPYAANLGDPSTSASRLNLSQSANGLGCLLAPLVGAAFLFKDGQDGSVAIPYGAMGVFVLVVALVFTRVNLPEIKYEGPDSQAGKSSSPWASRAFTFGIIALFCYEIAEISINSFFINYATDDGWLDAKQAATVLSFGGLGLFLVGRVLGSVIMNFVKAEKVLAVCAVVTVAGALIVVGNWGWVSRGGLFACYAFESIMFPTIFALSLRGLGPEAVKKASSYMMMTPIGGAVGTFLMGFAADHTSNATAFIVPALGYAVVLAYALSSVRRPAGNAR